MTKESTTHPTWITRGKSIRQLIKELQSFENQDLLVEISLDDGRTHKPISLVAKHGNFCVLMNCEISPEPSDRRR